MMGRMGMILKSAKKLQNPCKAKKRKTRNDSLFRFEE